MKKKLILFFFVFTTITTLFKAQDSHLTFKGIPIDGKLNEFVIKMQNSGFHLISEENGIAMLKGDFASYKDCFIGVATLKNNDLVNKIVVVFPERETWSTLYNNYYSLKKLLTEKYGEPSHNVEKFDSYSEPKDDQNKMYEVKFDRCKYYSIFTTEKGNIELSIDHNSVTSCFVKLAYFDEINGQIIENEAKSDL